MKTRSILAVSLVAVLVILIASYVTFSDQGEQSDGFVIIHSNDTHCYYGEDGALGFSTLKALKDQKEAEGNMVFTVDTGDFLQGNSNGAITKGEASVEVMNAVGYDVGTLGNHEFDYEFPTMMERISSLNYPIICSNLVYGTSGQSVFSEYLVLEKGGIKVGFFGLLTPNTKDTTKAGNMGDTVVTDPIEAAKRMVDLLKTKDVDYIVCIGHLGVSTTISTTSDAVCHSVPGIDIFIDGHSHTEMEDGKICDGSRVLLDSDTVIASTGAYSKNVGIVIVESDGKISAKLYHGEKLHEEKVDAVIEKVMDSIKQQCSKKICSTTILLNGDRKEIRAKETNLGDLSADSLRILSKSDIALVNGGNIRKALDVGDITVGDAYDVQPFQNVVVIVTATGQDVKNAMEFSLAHTGEDFGGYLQISGFVVTWDPSKEPGSRVVSMKIDGKEISLTGMYKVAISDFLALGGNDNKAFVGLDKEVYGDQTQAFTSIWNPSAR